eukprot:scaffold557739_cov25-Prasinocladus_malaysianus.AAC.1
MEFVRLSPIAVLPSALASSPSHWAVANKYDIAHSAVVREGLANCKAIHFIAYLFTGLYA